MDPTGTDPQISQQGAFSAGSRGGVYNVTAQSLTSSNVEGSATVTISDILDISISPIFDIELKSGATQQFFGNIDKAGPISTDVTWSATGGTISATGLYTAGVVTGTFEIRATSVAKPSKFVTRPIKIIPGVAIPITISTGCIIKVDHDQLKIASIDASLSGNRGTPPIAPTVVECFGGSATTCIASGFEVSTFSDFTTRTSGSAGATGIFVDSAGQSNSRQMLIQVSSTTIAGAGKSGAALLQSIRDVADISACDFPSVSINP